MNSELGQAPATTAIDLRDSSVPEEADGVRTPWTDRLDQFVKALLRAVSLADIAATVVAYGPLAAGGRCVHVVLFDQDGKVAVSLLGGPALPSRRLKDIAAGPSSPWGDAVREGRTLAFPSTGALRRAYPEVTSAYSLPCDGTVITVPLISAGHAVGAATFGFEGEGPVGADVRAMLEQVAALTAQAARRAVIFEEGHFAAEVLQRAYLPDRLPDLSGLTFASRLLSAGEALGIAGDWCDAFRLPSSRVGLVVGDVAGHGIRAAVVMASLRAALRAFATVEASPGQILARTNVYMSTFKPDAFATVFVATFDPADGRWRYSSAGHPPALVVWEDRPAELLTEPLGPPLGVPGAAYRDGELPFPEGTALVVYTDGLVERRDRSIDEGVRDLVRAASSPGRSPESICDRLVLELLAGVELFDDATLLVVARDRGERPPGPAP